MSAFVSSLGYFYSLMSWLHQLLFGFGLFWVFFLKSQEVTPRMTYSNKGPGDQCLARYESPVFETRPFQNRNESSASPAL